MAELVEKLWIRSWRNFVLEPGVKDITVKLLYKIIRHMAERHSLIIQDYEEYDTHQITVYCVLNNRKMMMTSHKMLLNIETLRHSSLFAMLRSVKDFNSSD